MLTLTPPVLLCLVSFIHPVQVSLTFPPWCATLHPAPLRKLPGHTTPTTSHPRHFFSPPFLSSFRRATTCCQLFFGLALQSASAPFFSRLSGPPTSLPTPFSLFFSRNPCFFLAITVCKKKTTFPAVFRLASPCCSPPSLFLATPYFFLAPTHPKDPPATPTNTSKPQLHHAHRLLW